VTHPLAAPRVKAARPVVPPAGARDLRARRPASPAPGDPHGRTLARRPDQS